MAELQLARTMVVAVVAVHLPQVQQHPLRLLVVRVVLVQHQASLVHQ